MGLEPMHSQRLATIYAARKYMSQAVQEGECPKLEGKQAGYL